MRNITIDDFWNQTAIAFSGTGWAVNKGRGYAGSYTSCSSVVRPRATFNFTGTYSVGDVSFIFFDLSVRYRVILSISELQRKLHAV